jgi:hypothetical protein
VRLCLLATSLGWRIAFVFLVQFREIIGIAAAYALRDLGYGTIGFPKQSISLVDSVPIDIIDEGSSRQLLKRSAKVEGVKVYHPSRLFQGERRGDIRFDVPD